MQLTEFITQVSAFDSLKPREKILLFAWFLHVHRSIEIFDNATMRACFSEVSAPDPNVARELPRLAQRNPPELIKVRGGYKLAGAVRRELDTRHGLQPNVIAVTKLLAELPGKLPRLSEQAFLSEALDCYKVKAYRAAIVMTWNLAFDHLLDWILEQPTRVADFNSAISKRFPKKVATRITKRDDFEELKEFDIIEICNTGAIVSKNIIRILHEKLTKRNISAHPSTIVVTQSQADDVITDLINNVVLMLKRV